MPTINKPHKTRYMKHDKAKDIYDNVYNTTTWRNIRCAHLMLHPICENCHQELATEVHHINEISNGNSIEEYQAIGFDYNNLMSVCPKCHHALHKKKEYAIVDRVEDIEYRLNHIEQAIQDNKNEDPLDRIANK